MSNVLIDREKIDILANAISDKSGVPVTMTLDEMVEAVDGIETGGGEPNLQAKTYTVDSAGTETVTADSGYDGLSSVAVSVPSVGMQSQKILESTPSISVNSSTGEITANHYSENSTTIIYQDGWVDTSNVTGFITYGDASYQLSTQAATTITPTESSQTAVTAGKYTTGAVTVGAISSSYVGSGITRRSSSDLTASGATVTVPSGYYSAQASNAVASGTAGTPTASKGTVSNHSISVTPSVTNTSGYISGGTINGTAVTVTASELASGNKAITANGTGIDVVGYSTVSVDVQGGGGSPVQTAFTYPSSVTSSTVTFTGLQGEPTSFILMIDGDGVAPSATAIVDAVVFDGSNLHGQTIVSGTNAVTYNGSAFSKSYSNGTLTITSNSPQFDTNQAYILNYTYGGSASNIDTKDVQVGSGATSITFTGLEDEPLCWSCIFKSNFGTSSGYQRVIFVDKYGNSIYGHAMDSATRESASYWTASYNNGSMTITSQGTNQGGYFHQPGYYQLTYAYDDGSSGNYQTKTVTPTTSAQEVTADTGYDALRKVTVSAIPSEYIVPSGNINITSNTATGQTLNVAQYATATVAVPSSGSSKNVQVLQSTSRTNSSSLTKVLGDLTVAKTGTYDVYWSGGRSNTSTSYTWGTRLYVDGTGYGTENTTWTNNCQSNHLSNVSLTANQKLSVYARGRSGSYYTFAPMLVIIEA